LLDKYKIDERVTASENKMARNFEYKQKASATIITSQNASATIITSQNASKTIITSHFGVSALTSADSA
jgi:hypothetical protein